MDGDDDHLAERIARRDAAALGEYLQVRRATLLAFIERRLGAGLRRKVEPDDILQETSAEAVRALKSSEISQQDVFGWLCQIAERRIIDAHRRFFGAQKRSAAREVPLTGPAGDASRGGLIDLIVASLTTASQAFSRNQREAKLHAALDKLPSEMREAVRLRYVEGLPSKEIAQRLGKSDGAVRVMLTRTLDRLQTILGADAD